MTEPFEVSDEDLLRRVVRNARSHGHLRGIKHPRWVAVMSAFAVGSTYANIICRRFGFDPDEMVKR